ncbi:UNVERIFIED_CONTAM: hypothetical protein NCL1_17243 [Trichonephila clavipes]
MFKITKSVKLTEDRENWWSNTNTGLRVKFFLPKPSLEINPHSSYVTQLFTNHETFVSYWHGLKSKATANRLYSSVGDVDHYLCMFEPCNYNSIL